MNLDKTKVLGFLKILLRLKTIDNIAEEQERDNIIAFAIDTVIENVKLEINYRADQELPASLETTIAQITNEYLKYDTLGIKGLEIRESEIVKSIQQGDTNITYDTTRKMGTGLESAINEYKSILSKFKKIKVR